MIGKISLGVLAGAFALLLGGADANAQATRTWVSGVGDDANPCSRTAPCKTFAGAISKTATNGIMNCIDDGAYGAVTITKSITIDCHEQFAGVLAAGSSGIIINIAVGSDTNRTVHLRNLNIDGIRLGLKGISILSAAAVYVEDMLIQNFTQEGISAASATDLDLYIRNSIIIENAGGGVSIIPPGTASATSSLTDVRITGNGAAGLMVSRAAGANAVVTVDNSEIESNGNFGVRTLGGGTVVRLSNSTVTANTTGLSPITNSDIVSFGNNVIFGNGTNGAPTSTVALE
jgi:hypothetical protein